MYSAEKQDEFIELRAQGWSLAHIARHLSVSKRTLVDWNREFAKEIQDFRAIELEFLHEKINASREQTVERLTRLQKDVDDELVNRNLRYVQTEKLFRLSVDLRQELERVTETKDSQPVTPNAKAA